MIKSEKFPIEVALTKILNEVRLILHDIRLFFKEKKKDTMWWIALGAWLYLGLYIFRGLFGLD